MVGKHTGLRFAIAMLAAALFGGPALAAPLEPESAGLQVAALVAQTTDMPAAQVAIAGPENVYSVEPLGPPAATGEVIARVRTEAVDAKWSATHKLQSWEAHVLFDCTGKRVRIIRSASYSQPNLKGESKVDDLGGVWFAPKPAEPAATLLSAACDRTFAWPLRASAAQPPAATDASPLMKAKFDPPTAPAKIDPVAPAKREPARPEAPVRKIAVATSLAAPPPATGPPAAPRVEEAANVLAASVPAAAQAIEASQPTPPRHIKALASAPGSAVSAVRRLADAGEGFVSRRASSVRRWFAWREPREDAVRQAAL